jgi:transcriptional regulator with XRE-family HTH domain
MKAVQCRMARAALQLGVRELAALAQVSTGIITKLERGEALLLRTAEAVQRALEAQGVEFIDNPPGARLRGTESLSVGRSTPRDGDRGRSLPSSTRTPERHKARDPRIDGAAN